jgi:hypothetical protein
MEASQPLEYYLLKSKYTSFGHIATLPVNLVEGPLSWLIGTSNTSSLKGILRDLDTSEEVQRNFHSQDLECEQQKVARLEGMLVHVLWKLTKPVSLRFQLVQWIMKEHSCESVSHS